MENFQKLVLDIPVVCADAVYNGIGSAWAVTNESMRKAGVLVIDLGGGTTDLPFIITVFCNIVVRSLQADHM